MAKRQFDSRGESRGKPKGKSPWLFRWLRRFIFLIILLALGYWQRSVLTFWANAVITNVLQLFGWGLVFTGIVIGALIWVIWLQKLSSLIHRWRYWLGSLVFMLIVWGILAFLGLGGSLGLGIIGYPGLIFLGVLRLVGLLIIGIILVAPRYSWRLTAKLILWLARQFKRQLVSRVVPYQKPSLARVMSKTSAVEPERAVASAPMPTPSQQELKQVAQEVWKKYGEAPGLLTVDGWRLPPIEILEKSPEVQFSQADNLQRARLIEEALASYGVEAKVAQINAGPTVTQFGVEPGWDRKLREIREKDRDGNTRVRLEEVSKTRVKVERISSLANDLALALAASSIRIEAPVPGKSVVGIEVPNTISSIVSLRGVIETNVFQKMQARSKLTLALGKGAGGEAVTADLARMPHLLIAGATGSGKTVCLNGIVCCLLLYNTPDDIRFILIDPKRVELTVFNSIPHLVTPVIVDTGKALDALRWLNQEMDKRYQTLATVGVRNIEGYNKNRPGSEKMPYLVLIVDELADLMMVGGDEVERILCRLAQLSRAVGIHLVVATQRPSVDVITGLIKANFPTRISFAVTSQVDSRTILDGAGAEKLLGKGDMLYMPTEADRPKRLQGCFVSDAEAERLVYFWGSQQRQGVVSLKVGELVPTQAVAQKRGFPEDPLLGAAKQLAREHEHISTSYLQRKLRIGYPRAARIMEQLEEELAKEKGEGEEL